MIGETLGSYKIIDRLGAGGMGEVYLAQHTRIDRRAAIKVLLPEHSGNQNMVTRFFKEARATSSIHHRGIVEVLDCDVHPSGRAYIIMELLEGDSLAGRLAREPAFGRDQGRALAVAAAVADAVGAAHAKMIIHRDLKPDNIFLATDATARFGFVVKILDFGIAKLMGGDGDGNIGPSGHTRTGSLIGTPAYMSPEQCRGGGSVLDHRTDIYSLGCVVFEMFVGRAPFVFEGFGELISAHLNDPPPAFAQLGVQAPAEVEAWVRRLLAKAPDARPATMAEVADEARALQAQLAGAAPRSATMLLPTTPDRTAGLRSPPTTTTFSEHAAEAMTRAEPPRMKMALLGAGVLGVASLGVFWMMAGHAQGTAHPAAGEPNATARPTAAADTVTLSVDDEPKGLTARVDGKEAPLPLRLPRGAVTVELSFRAPGFRDRILRVAPSVDRTLTLGMQPIVDAPTPAVAPSHEPPAAQHVGGHGHHNSPRLTDEARKL